MSKKPIAIVSTDKHLKEDNALELLDLAEQEIALAKEMGVSIVIWLGDIFDSRLSQRQEILICLTEMIEMYYQAGIQIKCIPGNHDKTDYTADESFLTPYKFHPGFKLIEIPEIQVVNGVHFSFIPFYTQDVWLEKFGTLDPPSSKKSVLFSHIAVQGSINNDGTKVESKIKLSLFKNYGKVFLGHYHNAHQPGVNVFHLPATRQNNFGEDEEKGFTVLYDNLSFDLVKASFKPYKAIEVNAAKVTKDELLSLSKTDSTEANIRVVITGDQQAVKSINKKWFTDNGITVKAKYEDVEVENVEEATLIQEISGNDLKQKFQTFCEEKGYDYSTGYKLLKEIMQWQE